MEKALEILKQVKELSGWIKCGAELPFDEELDEAIAELEEAMKPKTCEGCKHIKGIKPKLGQTYCAIGIEDLNYDLGVKKEFCCNKHEPKDN